MKRIQSEEKIASALQSCQVLIVGAGLSGAVLAERAASAGLRVLVLEQRAHVAGNCHDHRDEHGVMVHAYGPHIFHSNRSRVVEYLSGFTAWTPYTHRVLADIDGQKVPVPFNLTSLRACFTPDQAAEMERELLERYAWDQAVPITELMDSDSAQLRQLGDFIFTKVFRHYTLKQWGIAAEQLSPEVLKRVPVVLSHDDRYFRDRFQQMPTQGYTAMVEKLLSHPNVQVALGQDASRWIALDETQGEILVRQRPFNGQLVYTGPLDALFGCRLGALKYRSLQFHFEHQAEFPFQATGTVNYPNHESMTRITEFRHLTGQADVSGTTIVREYPQDYDPDDPSRNIPYYPLMNPESRALYERYQALAKRFDQLIVCGRLGDFRYYNMDDAVSRSLELAESLAWSPCDVEAVS